MPHAKLVYVSATGASSVRGLAPMPRLGLWGTAAAPFADFKVLPLTPTLTRCLRSCEGGYCPADICSDECRPS